MLKEIGNKAGAALLVGSIAAMAGYGAGTLGAMSQTRKARQNMRELTRSNPVLEAADPAYLKRVLSSLITVAPDMVQNKPILEDILVQAVKIGRIDMNTLSTLQNMNQNIRAKNKEQNTMSPYLTSGLAGISKVSSLGAAGNIYSTLHRLHTLEDAKEALNEIGRIL